MSAATIFIWLGYGAALLGISRWAKSGNALAPGKVGVVVQAFAYMATYISAVALVGFGGLCHKYGLQMLLVAAGNIWLGTWFVYKYLAWPTRLYQRKFNVRTPAAMLSCAFEAPGLRVFLGAVSSVLLIVYGSAVFKGAAIVLASVLPVSVNAALLVLVAIVGVSVTWGGLRGVLYTEALQGVIMFAGVTALLIALCRIVGGPVAGLQALGSLPPTPEVDNGFLALSTNGTGIEIVSLAIVTSVGVWAQPQLIQRHFSLKNRGEAVRVAPIAMLALVVVVGGTYFAGALSRLVLGANAGNPDTVIPHLVNMLLPSAGQHLFALAVVSASLSTASALLHIASGSIWEDIMRSKDAAKGWKWQAIVMASVACCGVFALISSSIISLICSTSWSLIASAILVPYLALIAFGPIFGARAAWMSSVCGFAACIAWYCFGYAPVSMNISGVSADMFIAPFGILHPIFIGVFFSFAAGALCHLSESALASSLTE